MELIFNNIIKLSNVLSFMKQNLFKLVLILSSLTLEQAAFAGMIQGSAKSIQQNKEQEKDSLVNLLKYVNALQGTNSTPGYSYGNVYPAIALPFGMNFWSPQTGKNGDG